MRIVKMFFGMALFCCQFAWAKDSDLDGVWCVKGEGVWQHEYETKPKKVSNQCYSFKVLSEDNGRVGSGYWIGTWEFSEQVPVRLHPLQEKTSSGNYATSSPGIFSFYRDKDGAVQIKMISVINQFSGADVHLDTEGVMHFLGYKYPQDLDSHQSYTLALELSKKSDVDVNLVEDWKKLYEKGQRIKHKMLES